MSGGSGQIIPPGYSAPFYQVTDDDHTAWIIIATTLGLCWLLLFAAIRLFIRKTISPGWGLDDYTAATSTVLAVIQSSIVLGACSDGLGQSVRLISDDNLLGVQKMYYTSNIFFIIVIALSKLSVVCFLFRLTVVKSQQIAFYALGATILAWMVGSVFAVALQCNLSHPWIIVGEQCSGSYMRWKVIGAFDIITEIAIVGCSLFLVWGLYTSFSKKAIVVCAFGFRLGVIVAIGFRLGNFDKPDRVTNPTLAEALFIVWTQTEQCYSLIAATIPCLRPFVSNLNTQFGGLGAMESEHGYGYGGSRLATHGKNTFQMSKMRSNLSATRSANRDDDDGFNTVQAPAAGFDGRSDLYSYGVWTAPSTGVEPIPSHHHKSGKRNKETNISNMNLKISNSGEEISKADATSVGSNDSQRMIIKKDVTWEVHGE